MKVVPILIRHYRPIETWVFVENDDDPEGSLSAIFHRHASGQCTPVAMTTVVVGEFA